MLHQTTGKKIQARGLFTPSDPFKEKKKPLLLHKWLSGIFIYIIILPNNWLNA